MQTAGVSASLCSPNRSIECCMEVLRRSLLCWNINETYANARVQQPPTTPVSSISCCQCLASTNAALDCELWAIRPVLAKLANLSARQPQWKTAERLFVFTLRRGFFLHFFIHEILEIWKKWTYCTRSYLALRVARYTLLCSVKWANRRKSDLAVSNTSIINNWGSHCV